MCLTLRDRSLENTPYNDKTVRWKVVMQSKNGSFSAPYVGDEYNKSAYCWNLYRETGFGAEYNGFHVFVTRQEARNHVKKYGAVDGLIIKKIKVDGFLKSGQYNEYRSETWKKFKFLK